MESRKIEFAIGLYGPHVVKFINNILKNEITELNRNLVESNAINKGVLFGGINSQVKNLNGGPFFGAVSTAPFGALEAPSPVQPEQPFQTQEVSFKVEPQQVYCFNEDDKKKRYESIFKISTYYCQNDPMTGKPRILLMSSPEVTYRTNNSKIRIPMGFTKQDDNTIFHKYILEMVNLPEIVKSGNNSLMYEFHLFIEGIEYLMKEYIIPSMCNQGGIGPFRTESSLTRSFSDLSLAVLLAFGNEFQNTPLALNHYIMAMKTEKQIQEDKDFIEYFDAKINTIKQDFPNLDKGMIENFITNLNFEKIKTMYYLYN